MIAADAVPDEMRHDRKWVVWRREARDGKPTKIPYRIDGSAASSTDAATWSAMDEAVSAAPRFDGIGYVFSGSGIMGIDLDHCRDPETGVIDPWARLILDKFASWSEVSPSGTGVHVVVRATLPGTGRKWKIPGGRPDAAVEMYDRARYFTVTGDRLPEYPNRIEARRDGVLALVEQLDEMKPKPQKREPTTPLVPTNLSDAALIQKAMAAKNGSSFSALWRGDTNGHGGDDSAADLALCNHLRFWCGPDAARIDALFRQSGLYRDKWEREDYRTATIGKAMESASETYGSNGRQAPSIQVAKGEIEPGWTDLDNSERLVAAHGADLRHVQTHESWYAWDESAGLWSADETGGVVRRMKSVLRGELAKAASIVDDKERAAAIKTVQKFESARAIRDAVSLAQSHPAVAIRHDDFDRDRWMFHALDATIDLRTGKTRPHSRDDLVSKTSRTAWDPAAECPRWIKFLDEVFLERKELIGFVQRAVGCSLTGETRDHVVFIAHGNGQNGKTTFFNALAPVLGDYMANVEASTFLVTGTDGRPRNDVARLAGARMVTAAEIGEGRRLDEALVKSLSGGDRVTARFLHKEFFEFTPQFKVWISTNHKPVVRGTDNGVWRRLKLLPFEASFPPEKRDEALAATLAAEAKGILRWAIDGCISWIEDGLGSSDVVESATKDYRAGQDVVGSFIADCCAIGPPYSDSGSRIYSAFKEWAEKNGEHVIRNRDFAARLEERGFVGSRTKNGKRWSGIQVFGSGEGDGSGDA